MNNEEFYIGYVEKSPPGVASLTRRAVAAVAVTVASIAVLLATSQSTFLPGVFEYQQFRDYQGLVTEHPYPVLRADGIDYLLVAQGKHGASTMLAGTDGSVIRARGSLIRLGDSHMLELLPDFTRIGTGSPVPQSQNLGQVSLTGEIADSKCHFGVMNPGQGKVHRDCAVRCISGGVPPVFLVRDRDGNVESMLLGGPEGRPLGKEILPFVAEPVRISGRLTRAGTLLFLRANPDGIRRE